MNHVLLIEDDDIMLAMMTQMLEEDGCQVSSATDGDQGLQLFRDTIFDLVITDIVMPGKEGIEVIMTIRSKDKDIPIIAISGGGRNQPDAYLDIAKRLGVRYAFPKPLLRKDFLAAVRQCLGRNQEE